MDGCKSEGVLVGLTFCEHKTPHITLDINGSRLDLPIQVAAIVYFQMGELLETVSYFNDEDIEERKVVLN